MKTIDYIRAANILLLAARYDFEFDMNESLEENLANAEAYLLENWQYFDILEEECDISVKGNHGQHVSFVDQNGWEYESQGDLVDFSKHWHKDPAEKIYFDSIIDSEGRIVRLYYRVGETDINRALATDYNIIFNDDQDSSDKGFAQTLDYCRNYIKTYAGTNESYFADYKGGVVSIVNNKTGQIVESYSVDSGELIEAQAEA